jgi:hypothetical protein
VWIDCLANRLGFTSANVEENRPLSFRLLIMLLILAFDFLEAVDLLWFWLFFLEKHAGFWRVFLLCKSFKSF